jgi:hypothetical protein
MWAGEHKRYDGLCIGGPWAGERMVSIRPSFRVPVLERKSFTVGFEAPTKVREVVYDWEPAGEGRGHWLAEDARMR